jgi:Tol biopolymer transport system component
MATASTRALVGGAVAVVLALNGTVLLARRDRGRDTSTVSAEGPSAGSASLRLSALEGELEPTTTVAAPSTSVRPTTTQAPTTSTTRPPASSTSTSTTTAPAPAPVGVRGPGLYVLGADGSSPRRVLEGLGAFTWAPDGTRLAYSNGGDLVVVKADGSARTTLPGGRGALGPTWSPDGTRIAFTRSGGGIYVVRADGAGTASLVDAEGAAAAWAPDGRLVVIGAGRPSVSPALAVYDDAGARRVLATGAASFVQPAPSPDGRLVAYMTNRMVVAGMDGSGSRDLTAMCCGSESVASPLAWSADSRLLSFIDQGDIKVVGVDGTGERVLVPKATSPAWSPDGQRLAFADQQVFRANGWVQQRLQTTAADGSDRHTVFDAGPDLSIHRPEWSPDGRKIAVVVVEYGPPPGA